jgi:hypothetical protein
VRSMFGVHPARALATRLATHGPACVLMAKALAERLGIPYHEDRLVERMMGYRLKATPNAPLLDGHRYKYNGAVHEAWPIDPATSKPAEMHEVEFLTEEVWTRDHWPNTADDVAAAVARLPDGKITGLYYHGPSMTIVLLHPGGLKVGIRAGSIIDPKLTADKVAIEALKRLKKWDGP